MTLERPMDHLGAKEANRMSAGPRTSSIRHKIGWWTLLGVTGVSLLNHLSGPFLDFVQTDSEILAVLALAAVNTYALTVLLTAYRRAMVWAWWVTWTMIAIYSMTILYAPIAGRYYLGGAAAMAIAQWATWSGFKKQNRHAQTT